MVFNDLFVCLCVFMFPQAVCFRPGQLRHVQHGPAAPTALQGRPHPLPPRVAGEDLRVKRHQSGAAGHSRKVRPLTVLCAYPSMRDEESFSPLLQSTAIVLGFNL